MTLPASHIYAGFTYRIDGGEGILIATPEPGQHPAAWKEKHRRAALESFKKGQQW